MMLELKTGSLYIGDHVHGAVHDGNSSLVEICQNFDFGASKNSGMLVFSDLDISGRNRASRNSVHVIAPHISRPFSVLPSLDHFAQSCLATCYPVLFEAYPCAVSRASTFVLSFKVPVVL